MHNLDVPVEWEVRPVPSITPATGSDRREVASQPQGGFIDLSRKAHSVTDIPADTPAKSSKPQTIRELERALQTLGFSQRESKAVASGGFKAIHPTEELSEQMSQLRAALARNITLFERKTP